MRVVVKARANQDQIVSAIQVLEQLSCHIDDEAEESIRSTGKWTETALIGSPHKECTECKAWTR